MREHKREFIIYIDIGWKEHQLEIIKIKSCLHLNPSIYSHIGNKVRDGCCNIPTPNQLMHAAKQTGASTCA